MLCVRCPAQHSPLYRAAILARAYRKSPPGNRCPRDPHDRAGGAYTIDFDADPERGGGSRGRRNRSALRVTPLVWLSLCRGGGDHRNLRRQDWRYVRGLIARRSIIPRRGGHINRIRVRWHLRPSRKRAFAGCPGQQVNTYSSCMRPFGSIRCSPPGVPGGGMTRVVLVSPAPQTSTAATGKTPASTKRDSLSGWNWLHLRWGSKPGRRPC